MLRLTTTFRGTPTCLDCQAEGGTVTRVCAGQGHGGWTENHDVCAWFNNQCRIDHVQDERVEDASVLGMHSDFEMDGDRACDAGDIELRLHTRG